MIKSDVHRNCESCRCGRKRILVALVLMITFAIIFSSGCLNEQKCLNPESPDIPETEMVDLPDDLNAAIH